MGSLRHRLGVDYLAAILLSSAGLCAQVPVFIPRAPVAVEANPVSFTVGDFIGDGELDLVTANRGSSALTLERGLGNGFFEPQSNLNACEGPLVVAQGDFNSDGRLNLVSANYIANNISMLLGTGDGTFVQFPSLSA